MHWKTSCSTNPIYALAKRTPKGEPMATPSTCFYRLPRRSRKVASLVHNWSSLRNEFSGKSKVGVSSSLYILSRRSWIVSLTGTFVNRLLMSREANTPSAGASAKDRRKSVEDLRQCRSGMYGVRILLRFLVRW